MNLKMNTFTCRLKRLGGLIATGTTLLLMAACTMPPARPAKVVPIQEAQVQQPVSEAGPESDPIPCDEFVAQYQPQGFGTEYLEYLMAIQGVENAKWDMDTLGVYEKAIEFYIPASRCFPDQFGLELLRDVSTTLRARMKEMPPQDAAENATLYAGMQGLADMVDQALE